MAPRALIGGGALLRIESLPSRPLSLGEEDEGERKVRVFTNQCALPQERKRAEKKGEGSWSRLFVLNVEGRSPRSPYLAVTVDARPGMRACEFCKGEGQVSSEAGERWRTGKAMRDARVKQGRTQQQEAEWLGISPMELNDIEHGRRSLDEVKKSAIEEMES